MSIFFLNSLADAVILSYPPCSEFNSGFIYIGMVTHIKTRMNRDRMYSRLHTYTRIYTCTTSFFFFLSPLRVVILSLQFSSREGGGGRSTCSHLFGVDQIIIEKSTGFSCSFFGKRLERKGTRSPAGCFLGIIFSWVVCDDLDDLSPILFLFFIFYFINFFLFSVYTIVDYWESGALLVFIKWVTRRFNFFQQTFFSSSSFL